MKDDVAEWFINIRQEAANRGWTVLTEMDNFLSVMSPIDNGYISLYQRHKVNFTLWPSHTGVTALIMKDKSTSVKEVRCIIYQDVLNIFDDVDKYRIVKAGLFKRIMLQRKVHKHKNK